ncbi:hypothetical protein Acr_17g0007330 [Actinidia rufa]|uniref:Uncharacterized protein n=1 Tax=Actinidia rufa TaxID=165716 RepID=A0A7J0G309_9ERIC|nr:hypothetical protein Acr_17g0007330 [Actinidia rufa]
MSTIAFSHKMTMTETYRTWLIVHKFLKASLWLQCLSSCGQLTKLGPNVLLALHESLKCVLKGLSWGGWYELELGGVSDLFRLSLSLKENYARVRDPPVGATAQTSQSNDGGDVTILIREGVKAKEEYEKTAAVPDPAFALAAAVNRSPSPRTLVSRSRPVWAVDLGGSGFGFGAGIPGPR